MKIFDAINHIKPGGNKANHYTSPPFALEDSASLGISDPISYFGAGQVLVLV